jgi:hypothetical protein
MEALVAMEDLAAAEEAPEIQAPWACLVEVVGLAEEEPAAAARMWGAEASAAAEAAVQGRLEAQEDLAAAAAAVLEELVVSAASAAEQMLEAPAQHWAELSLSIIPNLMDPLGVCLERGAAL